MKKKKLSKSVLQIDRHFPQPDITPPYFNKKLHFHNIQNRLINECGRNNLPKQVLCDLS